MIYTHVLNRGGCGVTSPVDRLLASEPTPSATARALVRPRGAAVYLAVGDAHRESNATRNSELASTFGLGPCGN